MNDIFIKDIEKQDINALYETYNEILATIKSLKANIKEIPTKKEESADDK